LVSIFGVPAPSCRSIRVRLEIVDVVR